MAGHSMAKILMAVVILVSLVRYASSDSDLTAYNLLQVCVDVDSDDCLGYIEHAESLQNDEYEVFCYPSNINHNDKNNSLIKYIDKHTSMLQLNAYSAIRVAASELYPCE